MALVCGTAAIALYLAITLERPTGPKYTILADDSGRIASIACVINSARRAALRNAPLVSHIINALPKRIRFTILTNDPQGFAVVGDPRRGQLQFIDLPGKSAFTIWPQDPFVVLAGRDGRHTLLASREFERADDRLIAKRLAEKLEIKLRVSKLCFEGGNIVAGQRHVFIGATTIRYNAERLKVSDREAARRFQEEFGRQVLVVGPLPQPVDHIDMMFTPLDASQVAIADPGWGARLARAQLRRHPGSVKAFEQSCEKYYFGNPHIKMLRDVKGKPIKPPQVVGQTIKAIRESEAIAPKLDKLADELRRWGYSVRRFPFLFRRPETTEVTAAAKRASRGVEFDLKPTYPCLTYNNVLVENYGGKRIVYVPQYGWKAMDEAGRGAWKQLGYRVVPVPGFAISAMYGGALRCCAKVLKRD